MANWCHTFDFTQDRQGWSLTWPTRFDYGTYVDNMGWKTDHINWLERIYIWNSFPQRTGVTRIQFTYTATGISPSTALLTTGYRDSAFVTTHYGPAITDGLVHTYEWTGSDEFDAIGCHIILTSGTGYIRSALVEGEGINPFVPSIDAIPAGGGETVWVFRAPIVDNPSEAEFTTSLASPITIDSYAIDPLTKTLWLHASQGWVQVAVPTSEDPQILKPDGCEWIADASYASNDRIIISVQNLALSTTLNLTLESILAIVSNGVSDATSDYPLGNLPWPISGSGLPEITSFPISLQQVCSGTRDELHGLGYYSGSGTPYANPESHPGLDIFAPVGSDVYSVANNGLVVGIGVEGFSTRSAGNWGAAEVVEGTGYSVIVRYGHLYVLYGHLMAVATGIYGGKQVAAGERIGEIGTFPDSEPHLHLEIRSFGSQSIPANNVLVHDASGTNNEQGILAIGGSQALHIYDIAQFFTNTSLAFISDSASATVDLNGLGQNIENQSQVTFDTTTPPSPCSSGANPMLTYFTDTDVSKTQTTPQGYRGFVLGNPNPIVPDEPTCVTPAP